MHIDYILEKSSGKLEVKADLAFIVIYPTLSKNIMITKFPQR